MNRKITLLLAFLGALTSLFLPFRVQTHWPSLVDNERLISSLKGFDLFLPSFSIPVFIIVGVFLLSPKNSNPKSAYFVALIISILNGIFMAMIYYEISKTNAGFSKAQVGFGFYLLCFASTLLVAISFMSIRNSTGRLNK